MPEFKDFLMEINMTDIYTQAFESAKEQGDVSDMQINSYAMLWLLAAYHEWLSEQMAL